jgi:formylglycine-generating enzyme required for sulfatase activity
MMALISAAGARGQIISEGPDLDEAKKLVVMIEGNLDGEPTQGAGIVFAVEGQYAYIATAYHVVRKGNTQAADLKIRLWQDQRTTFAAEHSDKSRYEDDLAVLRAKIPAAVFPFRRLTDFGQLRKSQPVYAIGHPNGESPWNVTYLPGAITEIAPQRIKVDSPTIKRGHSGGALIDANKLLVGMVLDTDGTTADVLRIDKITEILHTELGLPVALVRGPAAPAAVSKSQPPAAAISTDPVTAHYIEQLKSDSDVQVRGNALNVLVNGGLNNPAAMAALIAALLDKTPQIRVAAANAIRTLKPNSPEAVTNLIIGLNDADNSVRTASINALAAFPESTNGTEALLRFMGSPPRIDNRAVDALIEMGADDPRLSEALLYEATLGDETAIAALIKKAPLPAASIERLTAELVKSLDTPKNYIQQALLGLVLQGGGAAGRESIYRFLATADAYHQSRLALAWLEIDHTVKPEILQHVDVAGVTAELSKAMQDGKGDSVYVAEGKSVSWYVDMKNVCNSGVRMRAAMGVLMLDIPLRDQAWNLLNWALIERAGGCSQYAVIVAGWLDPKAARPAIPFLATVLAGSGNYDANETFVKDLLVRIGDEETIALLEKVAGEKKTISGNEDEDPMSGKNLVILTARIRSRPGFEVTPAAEGASPPVMPPGSAPKSKPAVGKPVRGRDGLNYVWIPPGTFVMGCSDGDDYCIKNEYPQHKVKITNGFWMGQTEVTEEAYQRVMKQSPDGQVRASFPLQDGTWSNAQAYCAAVGMRLPTEAEWEYAARAKTTDRSYGDRDDIAWYSSLTSSSAGSVHEVGQKQANAWKLFDMIGNVWEWTRDWYDPAYFSSSPAADPTGPANGKYRVLRGASADSNGEVTRVSVRLWDVPNEGFNYLRGFRCAGYELNSP